jgi:hypothetical protein
MWHGELLSTDDRYEEALAIAADGLAAAQRDRQGWAYHMFETWHGRTLLRTGRLSEALAVLEGRFALEDGTHAAAVLDAAGIVALGRLGIHTGDTRLASRLADIAQVMLKQGTPAVRRHAGWLLAIFAMAKGNAEAARSWLRAPTDPDGRAIRRDSHSISATKCCSRASRSPRKTTRSRNSRSPQAGDERSSTPASTRSRRPRHTSAVCSSGTTRISERRSFSSSVHRDGSSWRRHSKTSAPDSPRPSAMQPSTPSAVP